MTTDYIRYDILTQEALRGVVRTVLTDAAAKHEAKQEDADSVR